MQYCAKYIDTFQSEYHEEINHVIFDANCILYVSVLCTHPGLWEHWAASVPRYCLCAMWSSVCVCECVRDNELCIFQVLLEPVVHLPKKGKAFAMHSKENCIGLKPAQAGQLGWLHTMQELCNQLWAVSVLNYIFFPQKPQEFFNRPTHKLIETLGRAFKMSGVNFTGISVCKGILPHPRIGECLISSLFCRGCNHLEFISAVFPRAFYFYFILLSLALFHCKRKEYIS